MTGNNNQTLSQELTLVTQLSITDDQIQQRVNLMDLHETDVQLINEFNEKYIKPNAETIIEQFYAHLLSKQEIKSFISTQGMVNQLKVTQLEYLYSFGRNFTSAEYFEYRLRIGIAHARIQLPMHIYLSAYSKLQALMQTCILTSENSEDNATTARYLNSLTKIILLDVSLAIDAYNFVSTSRLNESVQELEMENLKLENQLMHDALTGALSRAYTIDALSKFLAKLERDQTQNLSVALLDIDHFKNVNDTYGHLAGDAVLKFLSQLIQSMIRKQDYFGRYGGEEFLLVIVDSTPENTLQLVERIRKTVAEKTININNAQFNITISIGLGHAMASETTAALLNKTDKALYQAKQNGRNQVQIAMNNF